VLIGPTAFAVEPSVDAVHHAEVAVFVEMCSWFPYPLAQAVHASQWDSYVVS